MRGLLAIASVLVWLLAAISVSCSPDQGIDGIITEAYSLAGSGDLLQAQRKALQAGELLGGSSTAREREAHARLCGYLYFQQNLRAKADSAIRVAAGYAWHMNDTALLMMNLFNLGMCETDPDTVTACFGRVISIARETGAQKILASALEKQAQAYVGTGEYEKARRLLDESAGVCAANGYSTIEVIVTRGSLWLAGGEPDSALAVYRAINPDSLSVVGKLSRAEAIGAILTEKRDYKAALAYKDSVYLYTDSLRRMDGTKQVAEIENEFRDSIARKNMRFRILLWLAVAVVAVILVILYFVMRNLRLSRRQIELTDRISALNARIAELLSHEHENELDDADDAAPAAAEEDMAYVARLIEEKCRLSLEVFRNLPQYELLRKLNLIRNFTPDNKAELKTVYDAIIGRFSDSCSDIRTAYRGMTNDDCIFCVMNYVGCSREVVSLSLGASDEALRRRKSRIKQKLPEAAFAFFFTK